MHCNCGYLQLYTRITKQGWFDSNKDVYIFRGVIDDVNQFLAVCIVAVCSILLLLVVFINCEISASKITCFAAVIKMCKTVENVVLRIIQYHDSSGNVKLHLSCCMIWLQAAAQCSGYETRFVLQPVMRCAGYNRF